MLLEQEIVNTSLARTIEAKKSCLLVDKERKYSNAQKGIGKGRRDLLDDLG